MDRRLVRKHGFVGPHRFGDRKSGTVAHLDQLGGVAVIEGDGGNGFRRGARLAFPADEPASSENQVSCFSSRPS
jgi:hypothetical protein